MKNIVLIGMPGCGKTTFGRALAERLHRPFIDADAYLEEKEGRTIQSFFAESEKAFRDAEERTVEDLSARQGLIIATGGGVVKRQSNVVKLHASGLIIFIDRRAEDIVTDVEVEKRPLLKEGPDRYSLFIKSGLLSIGQRQIGYWKIGAARKKCWPVCWIWSKSEGP